MKRELECYFNTMYRASFIILYCDQQMHNYFTNYHTPTCIWNTCVALHGIDYKLPEDDKMVSKYVGVW